MDKRFELTLDEAVKNCNCIPEESKTLFIQGLHSAIDLYKSELRNEELLNDRYGISAEVYRKEAEAFCDKLNTGITAAKKLKLIVSSIDKGNSTLIDALNQFIKNSEMNLKIEKPKKLNRGRRSTKLHPLGLSFKSLWEFYSKVKVSNPEVMEVATLFFYEAGIKTRPDTPVEHDSNKSDITKLFKKQLSGKSRVTPYLQIAKKAKKKTNVKIKGLNQIK